LVDKINIIPCSFGCNTCKITDTSIFGCIDCLAGREKLEDGRCVCPDGEYDTGLACEKCDPKCVTCYGPLED